MYELLLKMKKKLKPSDWLRMVNQAKERGKLTDQEYQKLITEEDE
nr:hypothetical protein [uncultured Blautia sp.]